MGFIDNGTKSSATVDGTAAYQMAASGDLAGAWMILSRADSSSSVDIVYNKPCVSGPPAAGTRPSVSPVSLSAVSPRAFPSGPSIRSGPLLYLQWPPRGP